MIGQDAGRGALPRDRRRTSAHGEQGYWPGNAPIFPGLKPRAGCCALPELAFLRM